MVKESDFELHSAPVPKPAEGQVLVRTRWLAFEPAMRGWMEDRPNYIPPVAIGEVMRGMMVGEVVESNLDGYAPGDLVTGHDGLAGVGHRRPRPPQAAAGHRPEGWPSRSSASRASRPTSGFSKSGS